jgi:hypothetical protein
VDLVTTNAALPKVCACFGVTPTHLSNLNSIREEGQTSGPVEPQTSNLEHYKYLDGSILSPATSATEAMAWCGVFPLVALALLFARRASDTLSGGVVLLRYRRNAGIHVREPGIGSWRSCCCCDSPAVSACIAGAPHYKYFPSFLLLDFLIGQHRSSTACHSRPNLYLKRVVAYSNAVTCSR